MFYLLFQVFHINSQYQGGIFLGLNVSVCSHCNGDKTINVRQQCFHTKNNKNVPAVKIPIVHLA